MSRFPSYIYYMRVLLYYIIIKLYKRDRAHSMVRCGYIRGAAGIDDNNVIIVIPSFTPLQYSILNDAMPYNPFFLYII